MINTATMPYTATPKLSNAFQLRESTTIAKPVEVVFDFVVQELQHCYTRIAEGHQQFTIRGATKLVEGALIDCVEAVGDQSVRHCYVVKRIAPGKRITYDSVPSHATLKIGRRVIEARSNTYVTFEFAKANSGDTRLTQSIVIEMPNSISKVMASLTGTGRLWNRHLTEELHGLKREIEALA